MVLDTFLPSKSFREYVKRQLKIGEAQVLFVHAERKNGFVILEVSFRKTKEKSRFIFKDYTWYTVPDMEEIGSRGKLHDSLDYIRKKWEHGFYDAVALPNSVRFITDEAE